MATTNNKNHFPQKVEEVQNPMAKTWQERAAKLAMFNQLNPSGQFGAILGATFKPLFENWVQTKLLGYPKDTGTTLTSSTRTVEYPPLTDLGNQFASTPKYQVNSDRQDWLYNLGLSPNY